MTPAAWGAVAPTGTVQARDAVADRVLDQRLQDQRRHQRLFDVTLHLEGDV